MSQGIPTSVAEIETDILSYITTWYAQPLLQDSRRHRGLPTFSVLQRRYGKQGIGQYAFNLTGYPNVILWQHLSVILSTALVNLCVRGDIHWHHGLALAFYLTEGPGLALPLANWPITQEYDKLHWLPVYFKLGPLCDDEDCPKRSQ